MKVTVPVVADSLALLCRGQIGFVDNNEQHYVVGSGIGNLHYFSLPRARHTSLLGDGLGFAVSIGV